MTGQVCVSARPGVVSSGQVADAEAVTRAAVQASLPVAVTVLLTRHASAGVVKLAVKFAGERERLVQLRASLRRRMRASPLMDEARFARDMERSYRDMWRQWCDEG